MNDSHDAYYQRAVYVISVAAELSGMHAQTLRMYERKGLLRPGRTTGGSRRYSAQDVDRLRRIAMLTAAGLNLEGVRRVVELEDEVTALRRELEHARAENRALKAQYKREIVPLSHVRAVPVWRTFQMSPVEREE